MGAMGQIRKLIAGGESQPDAQCHPKTDQTEDPHQSIFGEEAQVLPELHSQNMPPKLGLRFGILPVPWARD